MKTKKRILRILNQITLVILEPSVIPRVSFSDVILRYVPFYTESRPFDALNNTDSISIPRAVYDSQ